jgi:hypothetical protein
VADELDDGRAFSVKDGDAGPELVVGHARLLLLDPGWRRSANTPPGVVVLTDSARTVGCVVTLRPGGLAFLLKPDVGSVHGHAQG